MTSSHRHTHTHVCMSATCMHESLSSRRCVKCCNKKGAEQFFAFFFHRLHVFYMRHQKERERERRQEWRNGRGHPERSNSDDSDAHKDDKAIAERRE